MNEKENNQGASLAQQSPDLNQTERLLRHIEHLSSYDSLYRLQSKCKPNQEVKDKLKNVFVWKQSAKQNYWIMESKSQTPGFYSC